MPFNFQNGIYHLDVVFIHIAQKTNHRIHSYSNGNEKQAKRYFFIKIWTNKSLTSKEMFHLSGIYQHIQILPLSLHKLLIKHHV